MVLSDEDGNPEARINSWLGRGRYLKTSRIAIPWGVEVESTVNMDMD